MNRKEKQTRDIKILEFIELNPMRENRTILIRKAAQKFKISDVHVWRIIKANQIKPAEA